MSKRLRKKCVLQAIEKAFEGVTLEDGVSLHETLEIDNHRKVLPGSESRKLDEVYDWRKLVESPNIKKFCWNGGIPFFDGKGFKFHLPAYLTMAIRSNQLGDIQSIMISCLTQPSSYRLKGFNLFSGSQKKAVLDSILYLNEFDLAHLDEQELAGLYKYWT